MTTLPYTITVVDEQYGLDDAGRMQQYKVVHYVTALGDSGSVRVLKAQFSGELAKTLVEADVAEHASLRGM